MRRDNKITVYVSDDTKATLERRAHQEGMDVSPYIDRVLRRYFTLEAEEKIAADARAAERIEELVALGKDELTELTREIAEMNARMGAYTAANFELMKENHPDAKRRDALAIGSQRIRKDVAVVQDELDGAADDSTDTSESRSEATADATDGDQSIFDELRGDN